MIPTSLIPTAVPPPATAATSPARKGLRIAGLLAGAGAMFVLLPLLLRYLFGPAAGGFDPSMLTIGTLAALQFFVTVSLAFAAWYFLFPKLYAYVRDCMEEKLFGSLTQELIDQLPPVELATSVSVFQAAERRKIAHFQFLIRCVRLLLSLLPFFVFLQLATQVVSAALTIVPH